MPVDCSVRLSAWERSYLRASHQFSRELESVLACTAWTRSLSRGFDYGVGGGALACGHGRFSLAWGAELSPVDTAWGAGLSPVDTVVFLLALVSRSSLTLWGQRELRPFSASELARRLWRRCKKRRAGPSQLVCRLN